MTDKILFENGAEIELKYDDKTYSDFTYVEKHIGIADFTTGIFYPGKDYDYGASGMTDAEKKLSDAILNLIKSAMEGEGTCEGGKAGIKFTNLLKEPLTEEQQQNEAELVRALNTIHAQKVTYPINRTKKDETN